jgi:GT2 family glycosyltransferase
VIIPVFQDWDRLAQCLEALQCQTLPASEFEIIIANNEPGGGSAMVRMPSNATIVHESRPGSYAARNRAVAAARGEYLAFTDSDCVPEPRWLEQGLAALKVNEGARVTGPVTLFREPGSGYHAYLYEANTAFPQRDYVREGHCVTANLLVARSVFDRVGPFDEVLSGGDTQWNLRAQRLGVPIIYDEAVAVGHPARKSLGSILRKRRRLAGTRARTATIKFAPFVLARMKPPLRRFRLLRDRKLALKDAATVAAMMWLVGLNEASEFVLVRMGLKRPNRR